MQTALISTLLLFIAHRTLIYRALRRSSTADFATVLSSVGLALTAEAQASGESPPTADPVATAATILTV